MSFISIIFVLIIAFIAGMESVLDSAQLHQPIVACSLIGIATGHIVPCVILGGTLQMIALGWANVGAAMAPDAALASVASAIILVQSHDWAKNPNVSLSEITTIIGMAVALATAGLALTMIVRTLTVFIAHQADTAARHSSFVGVEFWHLVGLTLQGLRVAIPAGILLSVSPSAVQKGLEAIPTWLTGGLAVSGGMIVAVGYAMVINMMATREAWPFFVLGLALAPIMQLTLLSLGLIGLALTIIYMTVMLTAEKNSGSGGAGNGDQLGTILDNY